MFRSSEIDGKPTISEQIGIEENNDHYKKKPGAHNEKIINKVIVMEHSDLLDNIQGQYLIKNYLAAFVMQTAYIESLIRIMFIANTPSKPNGADKSMSLAYEVLNEAQNWQISRLLTILKKSRLISDEDWKKLQNYTETRNSVMHDLVFKSILSESIDDRKLIEAYRTGQEIMDGPLKTTKKMLEGLLERLKEAEPNKTTQMQGDPPKK